MATDGDTSFIELSVKKTNKEQKSDDDVVGKTAGLGVRHLFVFLGGGQRKAFYYTVTFNIISGFVGFTNVYAMRVNLSVAIVYMVNNTALHNTSSNTEDGHFLWDESQQGIILGMFFYGYVVTQVSPRISSVS